MKRANRVWLNPDKFLTAFLQWSVTDDWIEIKVADCDRVVRLSFARGTEGLNKIDLIVAELKKMRATMEKLK